MSVFGTLKADGRRAATVDLRTLKSHPAGKLIRSKPVGAVDPTVRYQVLLKVGVWNRAENQEDLCTFL